MTSSTKSKLKKYPISFDVTSLFTMVLLDFTIDLVLKRIYDRKDIQTKISKYEMKGLLLLCTKSIHFTFDSRIISISKKIE